MSTTTAPLSGSLLYRDYQKTHDLLEEAVKEWAERAARNEQLNDETAGLLSQMTILCLRIPDQLRRLWEWGKAEVLARRLQDLQQGAEVFRRQIETTLILLNLIQQATQKSESLGYPIPGADELESAGDAMRATLQEVIETWSSQVGATPLPSYEELRSLADRFPPAAEWYAEADELF